MLAGAYETDTIKTSIMAFLVVFEKTECRHRPEQHKSGGFPPTPPVFSFFRLRRAVVAIVDKRRRKKGEDEDGEDTIWMKTGRREKTKKEKDERGRKELGRTRLRRGDEMCRNCSR